MAWLKNTHNRIFFGFLLSVLTIFPYSFKHYHPDGRCISADGLGYYAYLPATFIYNDSAYDFNWYTKAYYEAVGETSTDFFVTYHKRLINKYYPGQSFLWLPFFAVAHLWAKAFHVPANGFSYPYQLAIAMAAVFYLLLGLVFLRKLLRRLFHNELAALVVPVVLFYGSYLFGYTFYFPSHSHVYAFTFVTMFMYFAHSFFNEPTYKWRNGVWCLLCFVVIVCVRPLNGLVLLTLPAFIPRGFFKERFNSGQFRAIYLLPVLASALLIVTQFSILYKQTGSFFPNTYSGEHFYFLQPKLFFVLFSYHAGLFVYVPLAFLALFGIFFLSSARQKIFLPLTFFIVLYLYSAWWYWPITSRTLIDYYAVIAILLAALLNGVKDLKKTKISLVALLFVMAAYFQLKWMQILSGTLDSSYTYSELFWRHFFRIKEANTYAIPPSAILKQQVFNEDFEATGYKGDRSGLRSLHGHYAGILNSHTEYSAVFDHKIPGFFKEKGIKKIKFSFGAYLAKEIRSVQVYINVYDSSNRLLKSGVFYINPNNILYNAWDLKEFGLELTDAELAAGNMDHVSLLVWNHELKNEMYMDDVKTEFILMDKSYEVIQ